MQVEAWRDFVQGLSDPVLLLDHDLTIAGLSDRAAVFLGYEAADLVGRPAAAVLPEIDRLAASEGSWAASSFLARTGALPAEAAKRGIRILPGHAVTAIKVDGVQHELSTVPGVSEDVADIIGIVSPHETPLLDHLGDAQGEAGGHGRDEPSDLVVRHEEGLAECVEAAAGGLLRQRHRAARPEEAGGIERGGAPNRYPGRLDLPQQPLVEGEVGPGPGREDRGLPPVLRQVAHQLGHPLHPAHPHRREVVGEDEHAARSGRTGHARRDGETAE